ncbi:hypothetical protein LUZ60_014778 [Juncus effusus]|nr:hypothetical protein LUZ60_014778 [Juncus effusus]
MGRALLRELSHRASLLRSLSSAQGSSSVFSRHFQTGNGNNNPFDSVNGFERGLLGNLGSNEDSSFFRKLDRTDQAYQRSNFNPNTGNSNSSFLGGLGSSFDSSFDSLDDGMDEKLEQSAKDFKYTDEIYEDDYSFRPDVNFVDKGTYDVKDLDLTKPAAQRFKPRLTFETTTAEVLKKADFRNVRFLANFLTEAGIIIKRSQTKISAKAQRKVAREIKTARALGLMPFTTMGTKPFVFGRSMRDDDDEFEYDAFDEGELESDTGLGGDVEPLAPVEPGV